MLTKYDQDVDGEIVRANLNRLLNQTFSLLPKYEENENWVKPLQTIIVELSGMSQLIPAQEDLFRLICKLEGMLNMADEIEFMLFRRHIFEACSILSKLKDSVS